MVVEGTVTLEQKLKTTQMGVEHLSIREAKLLPALFGEVDILKTLQLKPGVQSGGEGTSGLFVRGGSADQNLVLLDNAVVYNPNHLFGLFSVFNSDAVQSVDLYKSGFPAQFGGRLSSVVDVKLREGDRQKYVATGGMGLISSRLTLEGPINKGKGSFIVIGPAHVFRHLHPGPQQGQRGQGGLQPHSRLLFLRLQRQGQLHAGRERPAVSDRLPGARHLRLQQPGRLQLQFQLGQYPGLAALEPRVFAQAVCQHHGVGVGLQVRPHQQVRPVQLRPGLQHYATTPAAPISSTRPTTGTCSRPGPCSPSTGLGWAACEANSGDGRINFGSDVNYDGLDGALYASDNYKASDKLQLEGGLRLTGFQQRHQPVRRPGAPRRGPLLAQRPTPRSRPATP